MKSAKLRTYRWKSGVHVHVRFADFEDALKLRIQIVNVIKELLETHGIEVSFDAKK